MVRETEWLWGREWVGSGRYVMRMSATLDPGFRIISVQNYPLLINPVLEIIKSQ